MKSLRITSVEALQPGGKYLGIEGPGVTADFGACFAENLGISPGWTGHLFSVQDGEDTLPASAVEELRKIQVRIKNWGTPRQADTDSYDRIRLTLDAILARVTSPPTETLPGGVLEELRKLRGSIESIKGYPAAWPARVDEALDTWLTALDAILARIEAEEPEPEPEETWAAIRVGDIPHCGLHCGKCLSYLDAAARRCRECGAIFSGDEITHSEVAEFLRNKGQSNG